MMMVAAAVALFVPAAAQADPAKPAVLSAAAQPGEHLICQHMYYNGHIVGRAICKTEHAWIRSRIRQQADVRDFQIRALTAMGGR
jgi:hypothetical protein